MIAIVLTVGVSIFILVSFALIIVGPTVATRLAEGWGLGPAFEWTWKILQWPIVFALASTAIALIYYFAPDVEQEWVWLMPGSVVATTLWLMRLVGFQVLRGQLGQLHRDLRLDRRRDDPAALVLHLGAGDSRRRRDER